MTKQQLEMRFDPQTINHLGLRMYSTLPPALAEIVSNSYDADAENVVITLSEENGIPSKIKIADDGIGLSFDEIQSKFLVIGRNRRHYGDMSSPKFNRLPTGKKGLGKLALFGLADTITISTKQDGKLNEFMLDWNDLMKAEGPYYPKATIIDDKTNKSNGTTIALTGLKRKTAFDFSGLADSLSRIFIFDNNFNLVIESPGGDRLLIDNKRKYSTLNKEFSWLLDSLVPDASEYHGKIQGELLTSKKPITPSSGLRGITLFSRGKLVNAPEFFSSSTSSHFYQYLTGWISADFVDLIGGVDGDVISTNRQSIDWEHPEMARFRKFLSGIVSQVNTDWRKKKRKKKAEDLKNKTGIDPTAWTATMPEDIKKIILQIIEVLGGEDALEQFTPVIRALHKIAPEYPLWHWRYLHEDVKKASERYYIDKNYYTAFLEATKKYVNETMRKSGQKDITEKNLVEKVFSIQNMILDVVGNYKRRNGKEFSEKTIQNIQKGQKYLSQGLIVGGRHPLSHEEIEDLKKSDLFSEKDCLDLLSLLSHLFKRLDNAVKKTA